MTLVTVVRPKEFQKCNAWLYYTQQWWEKVRNYPFLHRVCNTNLTHCLNSNVTPSCWKLLAWQVTPSCWKTSVWQVTPKCWKLSAWQITPSCWNKSAWHKISHKRQQTHKQNQLCNLFGTKLYIILLVILSILSNVDIGQCSLKTISHHASTQ